MPAPLRTCTKNEHHNCLGGGLVYLRPVGYIFCRIGACAAAQHTSRASSRAAVLDQCAIVLKSRGLVFWLDCVAVSEVAVASLSVVGYMSIIRSTNHRFRMVTIYRKPSDAPAAKCVRTE